MPLSCHGANSEPNSVETYRSIDPCLLVFVALSSSPSETDSYSVCSGVLISYSQGDGVGPLHRNLQCTHKLAQPFVEALKIASPGKKKMEVLGSFPTSGWKLGQSH